jgi:molybdate transport system substrate-binding protein
MHDASRLTEPVGSPTDPPMLARLAVVLVTLVSLARAADSSTLVVLAAASLTEALRDAAAAFEAGHPGLTVQASFAGSPTLAHQIEEGAPADVFAAADEATMQRLVDGGLIDGTPTVFARNRLAIVVPAGNPKAIRTLADLGRPGLVVVLCAPSVPAGRYAREAFAKAGVAVPRASEEADVKAVVTKVRLGEADGGIAYTTDVRAAGGAVEGVALPEEHDVIARYPVAVLRDARNRGTAEAFVAFLASAEGGRILARFGFLGR